MDRLGYFSAAAIGFVVSLTLCVPYQAQTAAPWSRQSAAIAPSRLCVQNSIIPPKVSRADAAIGEVHPNIVPCGSQSPRPGMTKVDVGRPDAGMTFNLTFDDTAMGAAGLSSTQIAEVHTACTYAASQFTGRFSDPIHINITVTAVSGTSTFGMSNTSLFIDIPYTSLYPQVVTDAKSTDDLIAISPAGSMPPIDPISGTHGYALTSSQAKALGYAPDNMTNDGTFTFGTGFSYTFDPNDRAVPGKADFVGIVMHEFSEIMGRIGLMGTDFSGTPNYMQFDLFHYIGPATRGLNRGPGRFFSIDNGVTLLKEFNDQTANGGDFQDWGSGTNDAFNAAEFIGTQNDMSAVDLRTMDVIGYDPSISTAGGVTVTGRAVTASGRGVGGAVVTISDADGVARSTVTSPFGYFGFDDIEAGQSYTLTATSKQYSFATRLVSISGPIEDVLIVAK